MPAYTFVSAGTVGVNDGSTPGQPAGKAAGHLLLAVACNRGPNETLTVPANYTLLLDTSSTANDTLALMARIATSSRCQIACFSGDVYTDLNTIVAHSAVQGSGSNTSDIPNPALSISTPNCLVIGIGKKQKTSTSDGASITSPAGLSNRIQLSWGNANVVGYVWDYTQQTTPSNISAGIWDQSIDESLNYASLIVALKTASAASGERTTFRGMARGMMRGM